MKTHFPFSGATQHVHSGYGFAQPIGNVYYVDSTRGTDSTGYGFSPEAPFATVAYAVARVTANNDDVIIVAPAHTESLSGAGAITCSTAGFKIIGLGTKTNRPTFTFTSTSTTWLISAANVSIENIRVTGSVDAVVKMFHIQAAGCTLDRVDHFETASVATLQFLLTTAAGTDLTVQNCRWIQSQTAASALSQWIGLVGADRAKIAGNFLNLKGYATSNPANGAIVGATTASADVEIINNRLIVTNSTGNIPISLYSGTTGIVTDNRVGGTKTALAGQIALASCYGAENYAANTVNTNGILDPVADS